MTSVESSMDTRNIRITAEGERMEAGARRYDRVAQYVHWIMAALILGNFILGVYMENLPQAPRTVEFHNIHKTIGLVILALAVLRLSWRLMHRAPPMPERLKSWEVRAARITHWTLYLLILFQPITGLMIALASDVPTTVFHGIELASPIAPDASLERVAGVLHWHGKWLLGAAVLLHIAAVVKHRMDDSGGVLSRMLPGEETDGTAQ